VKRVADKSRERLVASDNGDLVIGQPYRYCGAGVGREKAREMIDRYRLVLRVSHGRAFGLSRAKLTGAE